MEVLQNKRVEFVLEALSPLDVKRTLKPDRKVAAFISKSRSNIEKIIAKNDGRLLVICGPCSIHNETEALAYAQNLQRVRVKYEKNLELVMRCYFEKPRTTGGWKGYINDPDLNDTFDIDKGLYLARKLLLAINEIGVPVACELLDVVSPQYISDLISWGAIGARTTESQLHRELASGLSFPVGFKNGTSGDVDVAIDGVNSSKIAHNFLGISERGRVSLVRTLGNNTCHIILRGGKSGTNYSAAEIKEIKVRMAKKGATSSIVVDASHGNSLKDYNKQSLVIDEVLRQIEAGEKDIKGVMIESNLHEGNQNIDKHPNLKYGVRVTDACISWESTLKLLVKINDTMDDIL
jgi:3-deoxy-7-phosphoheptulonate synthase